jgi:hypothetical protein
VSRVRGVLTSNQHPVGMEIYDAGGLSCVTYHQM